MSYPIPAPYFTGCIGCSFNGSAAALSRVLLLLAVSAFKAALACCVSRCTTLELGAASQHGRWLPLLWPQPKKVGRCKDRKRREEQQWSRWWGPSWRHWTFGQESDHVVPQKGKKRQTQFSSSSIIQGAITQPDWGGRGQVSDINALFFPFVSSVSQVLYSYSIKTRKE